MPRLRAPRGPRSGTDDPAAPEADVEALLALFSGLDDALLDLLRSMVDSAFDPGWAAGPGPG